MPPFSVKLERAAGPGCCEMQEGQAGGGSNGLESVEGPRVEQGEGLKEKERTTTPTGQNGQWEGEIHSREEDESRRSLSGWWRKVTLKTMRQRL